jgi:hypothetical protein
MVEAKDFFRFYINGAKGRLAANQKPTVETMKARAEDFYRAFTHETKTETDPKQRTEIYRVRITPTIVYSTISYL